VLVSEPALASMMSMGAGPPACHRFFHNEALAMRRIEMRCPSGLGHDDFLWACRQFALCGGADDGDGSEELQVRAWEGYARH
jgi:hypothetical protein